MGAHCLPPLSLVMPNVRGEARIIAVAFSSGSQATRIERFQLVVACSSSFRICSGEKAGLSVLDSDIFFIALMISGAVSMISVSIAQRYIALIALTRLLIVRGARRDLTSRWRYFCNSKASASESALLQPISVPCGELSFRMRSPVYG